MKKPTLEQIKEFWEWCEFEWRDSKEIKRVLDSRGFTPVYSQSGWYYNGKYYNFAEYPPIDLNNLFKYAVPKLDGYVMFTGEDGIHFIASKNGINYEAIAEKEEDAAFQAIYEVIK